VAIAPNTPTASGGAVTAYSVAPTLPAGLGISATTGVISGTPAAVTALATYTVTASNAVGSTTATLTITINGAAPTGLSYTTPAPVYAAGTAITPDKPISTGGAVTSYTIAPFNAGGPAFSTTGLAFDPATGIVSGTPTAPVSPIVPSPPAITSFTVTATNSVGQTTTPLTITVYSASQGIPNMGQSITPLAPTGSNFQFLDTGMKVSDPINPLVPPVEWMAGQAVSTAISPDGNTLLILTSGYNRVFQGKFPLFDTALSNEYVFIYDISNHTPVFQQSVQIPNAYHGIAWDPIAANHAFYVSGGMGDAPFGTDPVPYPKLNNGDNVHIVTQDPTTHIWSNAAELDLGQVVAAQGQNAAQTIAEGHPSGNGLPVPNNVYASVNAAVYVAPMAAGIAISQDGQMLVVANYYNDSITIFTGGLTSWLKQWHADPTSAQGGSGTLQGTELDLRPGKALPTPSPGTPGGEYPYWVVMTGNGSTASPYTAYVSSLREREIDVVNLSGTPVVSTRIPVRGQPNKMTMNHAQTLLYVAEDETDTVDVIDINPADGYSPGETVPPTLNTVIETIPVIAPATVLSGFSLTQYTGANTNDVVLSPDETQLFVTNGNLNNVAVVALGGTNTGDHVVGLIPTGWYPNSVSLSADGAWAYVVNAKSPTGANPFWGYNYGPSTYPTFAPANEYNPQLTKAGLQSFPLATILAQFPGLTNQVTTNNRFANTSTPGPIMTGIHAAIQHVIYILKENRTYDQILGDLDRGNGDPTLAVFGAAITPNQHRLADMFVTLDNFRATAEVSYDGWPWSTSARAPDIIEHQFPINYAQRGLALDGGGMNRSVNVSLPTLAQRQASDPLMPGGALAPDVPDGEDLLPGQNDVASPDGPNNELNTGYLWNNALRAGLTVHDYGFLVETTCYNEPTCQTPLAHDPFSTNTIVAPSSDISLSPYTDPYFRGFDPSFPDYYRYTEWARDFDANYATGGLPNLTLVRFMHDHTGNFGTAIDNVNTPDRDVADNDYAVGLLVQKIAGSIYANNTLIFIVEDDAQDGADHVDSHRTTAYVVGAYVNNALVSTAYNTLDFVRTMEEVLGLPPMNLNDALATPMSDVFTLTPNLSWSFTAAPAAILYCTNLPLPTPLQPCLNPTPDAKYWARVTQGMDFTDADHVDGAVFNRILWKGMMGDKPYPATPTGKDLRQNREKLLAGYHRSLMQEAVQKPKTDKN
jgi:DNA-binding beta-propeller fold protein YncE